MTKIIIGLIILGVLGYGAYIYKDRFLGEAGRKATDADYESRFKDLEEKNTNNEAGDATAEDSQKEQEKIEKYLQDCDNNCSAWEGIEHEACLQACGLSQLEEKTEDESTSESCEEKGGEVRDYCFRAKALKEKDDSWCNKITNEAIKETCIHAVAEEILEGF
ncbi:MAG: hypothetical protein U9Q72_00240 [Patescibacteria group bacterium]|nr:hypothetical protein [Patescibacteria group bacterium]